MLFSQHVDLSGFEKRFLFETSRPKCRVMSQLSSQTQGVINMKSVSLVDVMNLLIWLAAEARCLAPFVQALF